MAAVTSERPGTTAPARPIRIALVDDDPMVRAALRLLLGGSPDMEVVAEAADGIEAEAITDAHRPDVLLMDIRMPRRDGLETTKRLRARVRPPQIIVLTAFHVDEYVLNALRAGASGFLLKESPPMQILAAIRSVAAGAPSMSPEVVRSLVEQVAGPADDQRRQVALREVAKLTERERDVAVAIGRCWTNATIAEQLGLELTTVKKYTSNVFRKLSLTNRGQVAVLVRDARLL
ncbi:response regulator transcription factor [Actinoplanes sp. RD1]|uniref:response regulator transcription factor n=1 Tax=Actinoplanes sp. RD1 TaxID=3064538 RepID=UPI0027428EDA|nr:response regulator transcription factor [Actinoplanes sp. RD1]